MIRKNSEQLRMSRGALLVNSRARQNAAILDALDQAANRANQPPGFTIKEAIKAYTTEVRMNGRLIDKTA